jgi:RsiW-degrading membrane proteinase PrsW (M82 family)
MTAPGSAAAATPALPAPPGDATRNRTPRWGLQIGFVQPRMPAFWLFVVALVLGALYAVLFHLFAAIVTPEGWLLSLGLMLLFIIPVALVIRWLDLYEREPRSMVIAAFAWGALVVPLFAGLGNDAWGVVITKLFGGEFSSNWSAALTAPVIEETYKYVGIVLLFLVARLEFDDLIDGFVYGALIGLGFAVSEDIFYFIFVFGGDVSSVIHGFWLRVVETGVYGHVTFTGISGIGLAYFVSRRFEQPLAKRLLVAAGLLLLAMLAHFTWNSPFFDDLPILLYGVIKGLPFLIGLAVLVYVARRREHFLLTRLLTPEVGRAGFSNAELNLLNDRHARRDATRVAERAGGGAAVNGLRRLLREDVRLALVATSVDSPDDARLIQEREATRQLRGPLLALSELSDRLGRPVAGDALPFHADHVVGVAGAWAWTTPSQTERDRMALAPNLPVQIVEDRGGWLLVRSQSGWHGWTGAPYLVPLQGQ